MSLIIFSGIGWLIHEYQLEQPMTEVFSRGGTLVYQIFWGVVYGLVMSLIAWKLVNMKFLQSTRSFFERIFRSMHLRTGDIIFISICAGLGEELLFRASIQPTLGIWLTALIFVALHGYLNPQNWSLSIYGAFMVLLAAGLGYLFDYLGIWAAVIAHALFDFLMLKLLAVDKREEAA